MAPKLNGIAAPQTHLTPAARVPFPGLSMTKSIHNKLYLLSILGVHGREQFGAVRAAQADEPLLAFGCL
jgi:hypothetical protein